MTRVLEVDIDDVGPGGIYCLVRRVVQSRPAGVTFDIAALEPFVHEANQREFEQLGCQVTYIGQHKHMPFKWLSWYRGIQRLLRSKTYDYIHLHRDMALHPLIVAVAAVGMGYDKTRIIVHSHSSDVDGNLRPLKRLCHRLCRRLLPQYCGRYVACSDVAAKWMFPQAGPGEVTIVRNGIDLCRFRYRPELRAEARRELGLERGEYLVGHVGRFSYQKNHPFLLRLFSKLLELRPNSRLLLVGFGEEKEAAIRLSQKLGIDDKVIFYGITDDTVPLYCAMDSFVLPSHFEGLPIVGVEAQALGLPCLLSDKISSMTTLVEGVEYLPIGTGDERLWAARLSVMEPVDDGLRQGAADILRGRGFDIADTVSDFLGIYKA